MLNDKSAVVFGAGSVGRGFLGQLFSESGYDIVFVDVDDRLVRALDDRGVYTLRLASVVKVEALTVGPVRAVDGTDTDRVAAAVAKADLMATAVGARALEAIAKPIAQGLAQRWEAGNDAPFNVIVCENLHDAPERIQTFIRAALPEAYHGALDDRVGFVPAVIARMSPVPTTAQRATDPSLIVAEPYKVLPVDREAFVGEIPEVVGMVPVAPFEAYTARKLYIHNAAHAILGYLGYQKDHAFGYDALDDPWVRQWLDQGLEASSEALIAEFGFEPVALQEHIDYLLVRFANHALADPVTRLARDPIRKLGRNDRLVGAARLAQAHGIRLDGIAWGIAGALAYDHVDDPLAVRLQQRIAANGVEVTLTEISAIDPHEPLGELVLARYHELT